MSERDPNELGALWVKTSAKGEYMTGDINGVKVVCFLNSRYVVGGNAPRWRIMKSVPKGEQRARQTHDDDEGYRERNVDDAPF